VLQSWLRFLLRVIGPPRRGSCAPKRSPSVTASDRGRVFFAAMLLVADRMIRLILTVIAIMALTVVLLPFQLAGIAFGLRLQR
jgi:hypothetical protein